eukprot:EG_transcript_8215
MCTCTFHLCFQKKVYRRAFFGLGTQWGATVFSLEGMNLYGCNDAPTSCLQAPISMHWQTRGGKAWWRLARCPCSACCAQSVPGVCSALHCATVVAKQLETS